MVKLKRAEENEDKPSPAARLFDSAVDFLKNNPQLVQSAIAGIFSFLGNLNQKPVVPVPQKPDPDEFGGFTIDELDIIDPEFAAQYSQPVQAAQTPNIDLSGLMGMLGGLGGIPQLPGPGQSPDQIPAELTALFGNPADIQTPTGEKIPVPVKKKKRGRPKKKKIDPEDLPEFLRDPDFVEYAERMAAPRESKHRSNREITVDAGIPEVKKNYTELEGNEKKALTYFLHFINLKEFAVDVEIDADVITPKRRQIGALVNGLKDRINWVDFLNAEDDRIKFWVKSISENIYKRIEKTPDGWKYIFGLFGKFKLIIGEEMLLPPGIGSRLVKKFAGSIFDKVRG